MIDSDFIIKYTNALYSTPVEYAPSYAEFRDMFSSGQIKSKEWFISNFKKIDACAERSKILIVGAWFGTLGLLIKKQYPDSSITLLDIDARCEKYINNLIYDIKGISAITKDMYQYDYSEDIIINTSCEHIENLDKWISLIPKKKIVMLQSNNYAEGKDHINCVNSAQELAQKAKLSDIWYLGELIMPMYTRYMVIAYT